MKKRYPILVACGLLATVGATALLANNNLLFPTKAADQTYTVTINAESIEMRGSQIFIKTPLQNDVEVGATGIQLVGSTFVLDSGSIFNIDQFQALTSLTVDFTGTLNLNYGFMVNTYVSVGNVLTSNTAFDLSDTMPTHFLVEGSATINSITATYSCDDTISGVRSALANEWHMVGEGSFLGVHDGEWAPGAGPKLTLNADNTNFEEWMLTEVELTAGDVFKFAKGVDWECATQYSSWKIADGNGSAFDKGKLTIDETSGDITVVETGSYSFYIGIDDTTGKPADFDGNDAGSWANFNVEPEPTVMKTLYVKAPAWWLADGAYCGIYYWGTAGNANSWPGTRMALVTDTDDTFTFEVDIANYQNVIFTRVNGSGTIADWGAKTADLIIPTDNNNFYTITSTEPVWGNPGVTGDWSVYSA